MTNELVPPEQPELFPSASSGYRKAGEDGINLLIRRVLDPIIVYPGYEDYLASNLKTQVRLERLARLYKNESDEECGDIEAMAYLHTASLAIPFNDHWTEIYLHTGKTYFSKFQQELDIESRELTDYEIKMLSDLKRWIRKQQKKRK